MLPSTTNTDDTRPESEHIEQKSVVWIERGGLKLKIVDGADPAAIEEMIDRAVLAMERLESSRPVPATTTSMSARTRIERHLVEHGSATGGELAAALGLAKDTIRVALSRGVTSGRFAFHDEDGVGRWSLIRYRDPRLDQ